jgi:undecaprenyl-diphosphatase
VTSAKAVTFWGNTPVVIAVAAVLVGWQVARHRAVLAWWLVLTLLSGWLLNHAMKAVVDRARPPTDGLFLDALGSSFPSGHAQVGGYAWVTFGLLGLLLVGGHRRWAVAWGCWLLGVGIALSRVLLGVHWLTDVVAGYAVGAGWALLCASALVTYARRSSAA